MRSSKNLVFFLVSAFVLSFSLNARLDARGRQTKKTTAKIEQPEESKTQVEKTIKKEKETPQTSVESKTVHEPSEEQVEEVNEDTQGDYKTKSPMLATGLAIFPGVLLHGVGHMYAGAWIKGVSLMVIEGAAVGVVVANISTIQDELDRFDGNKIPTNFGRSFTLIGVAVVSTAAFVWSWWDDIGGAPLSAIKYNERQKLRASKARFNLVPTNDFAGLSLSLTKKF